MPSAKGAGHAGLPRLDVLISSGEPLTLCLLRQLDRILAESALIFNIYGSTEVAADCAYFDARQWLHNPAGCNGVWPRASSLPEEGPLACHNKWHDLLGGPRPNLSPIADSDSILGRAASAAGSSASSSRAASGEDSEQVPVGWPINNMAVFTAAPLHGEKAKQPAKGALSTCSIGGFDILAPGELGEVCVAGVGVADGYRW